MKGKINLLARKVFATAIALAMSIPPQAFATDEGPRIYDASSSVMGINEESKENIAVKSQDDTYKDIDFKDYRLEVKSNLDPSLTELTYLIKAKRKDQAEESDANLSLNLTTTNNSNINDIRLVESNIEVEETQTEANADKLKSLLLKSKAEDEIIYTLKAKVNKAKANRTYDLVLSLVNEEEMPELASYKLRVEEKTITEDLEERKIISLVNDDSKEPKPIADYKEEGFFGGLFAKKDTITWTDYILNDGENEEFTYDFNLDSNQETENAKIGLDYYEPTENGFEIKKEFSQQIDFAKKINFEIPQGFIAKITLTTQVDKKNTAIENYSLNNRVTKNPIYIEGNEEKSSDDDEADGEEESKIEDTSEENTENKETQEESSENEKEEPVEKETKTEIVINDANSKKENKEEISAIILNKDSLVKRLESEDKLTDELSKSIADLAEDLDSYNDEKITDQELKDFTKALAERNSIGKSDLRYYFEQILSGLNKQTNKAANLNIDEIIDYAYPEGKDIEKSETEENLTNLEKADKELKEALADEKNGLEEIQALLDSFEEKYNLSREDQAKLMTANNDAIVALVEKDREENTRFNNLIQIPQEKSDSFANKEFYLDTVMQVKASPAWPIPKDWTLDVKVGPYLKINGTQGNYDPYILDLTDKDGNVIAQGAYHEEGNNHYIRYTFIKPVIRDTDLEIKQFFKFDTNNIGDKKEIDVNIVMAPKNNPEQAMETKKVYINDDTPVISNKVVDQGETQSGTYPYQLDWKTTSQTLRDKNNEEIISLIDPDLDGAYVEWDIEVNTKDLLSSELKFEKLYLTVFGSSKQGLKNFKFKASKNKSDLEGDSGYKTSDKIGELLTEDTFINKSDLGEKLYIRVKAPIDKDQVHETYSIGFRLNPDNNYIDNLLKEYINRFNNIPTPLKWLRGVEAARRFAEVPFNLVETMIPATFNGLTDKFTNEKFYYDNTRTIVADRRDDNRTDWYALDLIRRGENQDPALDYPTFDINNGVDKQNISPNKIYFVPRKDGGYKRTSQAGDALIDGQYYPGTIVSYEYENQRATRDDTYNFRIKLKDKKRFNVDESYDYEGGDYSLYTAKVSKQAIENGYLAYTEDPYPIMRIDKNFDLVSCFNDRIKAPVFTGKNGVLLDKHEDVSGDYLISRLNETIFGSNQGHLLRTYLKPNNLYYPSDGDDGVYLNHDGISEGQAMEELMKKIYFYGEEVKKDYARDHGGKEMHRLIEASMYQRVIHHFTDNKPLTQDYGYIADSSYNTTEWRVDHTLQGTRQAAPKTGWDGSFDGEDDSRKIKSGNARGLRKLKDNETRISSYPPVQTTSTQMANALYKKVIDSYKDGNDWDSDKADSVKLVFYSHTDEGKYQELIAGRVMAPIEIDKYDINGNKLEKAVFKFINIDTGERKEWTSDKNNESHKLYLRPGRYRVEEINPPQGYEKIKDFNIEVIRKEINPDNGPYSAKKLEKIHVNDGFKTEVALGNNIPESTDGTKLVTLDNDKIKVSVKNVEDNLGKFEFIKKNNFIKLDGAEFKLRKLDADTLEAAKAQLESNKFTYDDATFKPETSTGNQGEFIFEQIPVGFYILEEINVPAGYKKAPLYLVEGKKGKVAGKDTVVVSFVGDNAPKETQNGKPIVRNKLKETEIEFRKIREEIDGEEKQGLSDARFRLESLWTKDGSNYLRDLTSDSIKFDNGDKASNTSADKGYFRFEGLVVGDYKLTEIQAPYGYQVTDSYWRIEVRENEKGELVKTVYEVKKDKTEVKIDPNKEPVYELTNAPRKIDVKFTKYLGELEKDQDGKIKTDEDGKPIVKKVPYTGDIPGKDNKPVSFDLYSSDYYGAIIGKKVDGKIQPIQIGITRKEDGFFHLEGLEFGKYYVLRETNPPIGYDVANDIVLKVEAEAITNVGEMKVIVRDPNTNAETGPHSIFEGVIDFKEGEQLGKFTIRKTGTALSYIDKNGKLIENPKEDVGLRRAYFRLYTADSNFNIEENEAGYAKEYIQKVTPGDPIILYLTVDQAESLKKTDPDAYAKLGIAGTAKFDNKEGGKTTYPVDKDGKRFRIGKDPSELPLDQGIVTFDNLKPGYYVLEEFRGPAGYERTTQKWYVKVDNNGRTIRSENINDPAFAGQGLQARSIIQDPSNSPRFRMAGLDISEPSQFNRLMANRLEIGEEILSGPVQAGNVEYTIENTKNAQLYGGTEVTTSVKDLGDGVFEVQIDLKNKSEKYFDTKPYFDFTFNDNFNFKADSTLSWYGDISNAPTTRWHTAYNPNTKKIGIEPGKPAIRKGQTFSIKFEVQAKSDLVTGAYDIIGDITYRHDSNKNTNTQTIDPPRIRVKTSEPVISYREGYEDEIIPMTTETRNDPNLEIGKTRTEPGHDGTKRTHYRYEQINGKDTGNKEIDTTKGNKGVEIITQMKPQVIYNGTKQVPGQTTYTVSYTKPENGTLSGPSPVTAGQAVTVTATPYQGYKFEKITVIAANGQPVDINGNQFTMPDSDVTVSATFVVDSTQPSEGDKTLEVNFTYSSSVNGMALKPGADSPGKLELFEEGNPTAIETIDAVNEGRKVFTNKLDSSKSYKLIYTRQDKLAKDWALPNQSVYEINSESIAKAKDTIKVDIANGNNMDIYNKGETGFRIPLRITKVNENKGVLTGAQFRARKLLKSDQIIDKKSPVYGEEAFDGVSEATGLPGDNYFRELSPGLYELTEIKAPNETYRLPKDENGKDKKWYFKVEVAKDENNNYKKPSDDDYMRIEFKFDEKLPETKNDPRWALDEKQIEDELLGKEIKGIRLGDDKYDQFTQIIKDDHRSDPARPDAPYKGIDDVQVTNYLKTTELSFAKKDLATYQNIEGAEFTLKRAKVKEDGSLDLDNNGNPQYENLEETLKDEKGQEIKDKDGKTYDKFIKPDPYVKDVNGAKTKSEEASGVLFKNIAQGTYILQETQPAKGYKLNDNFLAIKFTTDENGAWEQVITAYEKKNGRYEKVENPGSIFHKNADGDLDIVFNNKSYIDLKFQKIEGGKKDGEEVLVESADFKLTQVDENGKKIEGGYDKTITSYSNSNFEFRYLPVGRYKLQETRVITKFEKPDPWFFNVVQDSTTHKLKLVFENDPDGKLDESIGFKTKQNGDPDYDEDGNLQDIKIRNYSKTNFSFLKFRNETDKEGNKLPLKDAYFRLKKVRFSMDGGAKTYEYYDEENGAGLKKYTNGKKVTEYTTEGTVSKYTYDGKEISAGSEDYKPDAITAATGKYSSLRRSQSSGAVDFQQLGEGIYQLEEVGIPEGYESANKQFKWIFEVKKTDDGLKVEHNVDTEKTYFETYDKAYYTDVYSKNNFNTKQNIEKNTEKNRFSYNITNEKTSTSIKWKKIGSRDKSNVIKKNTKFVLLKTSDNPNDLDSAKKVQSEIKPNIVENNDGEFEIQNLNKGVYVLVEDEAPEGYEKLDRHIAIRIYEGTDGTLKKEFHEIKKVNGVNTLVSSAGDFQALLNRNIQNPEVDTDPDGTFYVINKQNPYFFYLSKGYLDNNNFEEITEGKLKIKIKADPDDKTNDDKNVYEREIDLSKKGPYRIDVDGITLGVHYILEEVEAPDGYTVSENKYRLLFTKNTNGKLLTKLLAVIDPDGKVLKGIKNPKLNRTEAGEEFSDAEGYVITGPDFNVGRGPLKIVNNEVEVEFTKVGEDKDATNGEKPLADVGFYLEKQDPNDVGNENLGYYPLTENMEMIKPKTDSDGNTTYYYISKETGKEVKVNEFDPAKPTAPVKIYKSKKDGKFKIKGLTDGYYRVIEPEAPEYEEGKKYMQVNGPIKTFRVEGGKVWIYTIDKDTKKPKEKEVDGTTEATVTKIINKKPGNGEFELTKLDENNKALQDVEFTLHQTDAEETQVGDKVYKTDADGKIKFTGLPYGYYWLKETKTKDGYILDTKKKLIALGGGKWKVPPMPGTDVSTAVKFDGEKVELVSTAEKPNPQTVFPNKAEGILAKFNFKIDQKANIKAGDQFTIRFSDNVDLDGIYKTNKEKGKLENDKLDIIGPAGLLAKAKINDDRRSITYTFTDYLDEYTPDSMSMFLQLFPNRRKVDHKQDITVTADIGNNTDKLNKDYHYSDSIEIDYRGENTHTSPNGKTETYDGYQNPNTDVSSYMLRLDPTNKTFTAILYLNPWNREMLGKTLTFTTDEDILVNDNLSVKTYIKNGSGSHPSNGNVDGWKAGDLPDSYDIYLDEKDQNGDFKVRSDLTFVSDQYIWYPTKTKKVTKQVKYSDGYDYWTYDNYYGYKYWKDFYEYDYSHKQTRQIDIPYNVLNRQNDPRTATYVIEIKGQLNGDAKSLETYSEETHHNFKKANDGYTYRYDYNSHFETWSQFFNPGALGGASKEIKLVNFKNKIEFAKVDGGVAVNVVDKSEDNPETLKDKGIGLPLKGAKFQLIKDGVNYGNPKTSDDNGIFSWEELPTGKYEVKETESPDSEIYALSEEPIASFEVDKNGNIINIKPEDFIVENYRKAEIEIKKTDQDGNILAGADFMLTPTSGQKMLDDPKKDFPETTKTTDENGIAKFEKLPVGTYTLKEMKAPDGYKISDKVWNIEVTRDGKVKWTNSFDDKDDKMKTMTVKEYVKEEYTRDTYKDKLFSEILGIDEEGKTFRQKITIKARPSELNLARLILDSLDKDLKLTQINTKVRLVQAGENNTIKDKDNSSYSVEIENGESPKMILKIAPPYINQGANKPQGSAQNGQQTEDLDAEREYQFIVDMPYKDDDRIGAKVTYDVGLVDHTTGKVTFGENDIKTVLDKYATKENLTISDATVDMSQYKNDKVDKYIDRDINLITTDIGNIKQPDIHFEKVDADKNDKKLPGAEFKLQKKIEGEYKDINDKGEKDTVISAKWKATSDDNGKFSFEGLPDGDYKVVETKAPDGYSLITKDVYFFKVENGKITGKEKADGNYGEINSTEKTIQIKNKKAEYPNTGGPGTWIGFTIGGLALMIAGVFIYNKRKESIETNN